jgi:hypothetical protein
MDVIWQWDEAFLQEFAQRAPQQAFERQCAADRADAEQQVRRELSDALCGYRECPVRRCRRARKCMVDESPCLKLLQMTPADDEAQDAIDELYAELQEQRKLAAMEEAEEEW